VSAPEKRGGNLTRPRPVGGGGGEVPFDHGAALEDTHVLQGGCHFLFDWRTHEELQHTRELPGARPHTHTLIEGV
jgi:hypothetical protein